MSIPRKRGFRNATASRRSHGPVCRGFRGLFPPPGGPGLSTSAGLSVGPLAAFYHAWFKSRSRIRPKIQRFDFLGAHPKKVTAVALRPFALFRIARTPHPRPLSRKGRGVKDLEESARRIDSSRHALASRPRPTFLGRAPKNSPLFCAPKKPKKSLREVRKRTLVPHLTALWARLHGSFASQIIETETAAAWNEPFDHIAKDLARADWCEFFCHSPQPWCWSAAAEDLPLPVR